MGLHAETIEWYRGGVGRHIPPYVLRVGPIKTSSALHRASDLAVLAAMSVADLAIPDNFMTFR